MAYINKTSLLLHEKVCERQDGKDEIRLTHLKRFRENVELASHVAKKFTFYFDNATDSDDIYQIAYLGLWEACQKYDESRGFAFSTFAVPWIQGRIYKVIRDHIHGIKVARGMMNIKSLLIKYDFTLPLSTEEMIILQEKEGISYRRLHDYSEISIAYLDEPISDCEDKISLIDAIPDLDSLKDDLSEEELGEIIDKLLSYIKEIHRDIIEEWLWSTFEGCPLSQETLSKKYKLSQPQISRVLRCSIEAFKIHREEILELFGN